jgi:hypothetical protein
MPSVTETMKAIRYLLEKYGNVDAVGASPTVELDRPRHFPISKATRKEILRLHRGGMTVVNIAITVGRSITLVRNVLKNHVVQPQSRRVVRVAVESPRKAPQSPRKP